MPYLQVDVAGLCSEELPVEVSKAILLRLGRVCPETSGHPHVIYPKQRWASHGTLYPDSKSCVQSRGDCIPFSSKSSRLHLLRAFF